ncbi:hypothetical protein V1517DRAFT_340972 [Lipomyces orientalis]|uniref:Uncharacterized protein n=1 Tax=Lipomyces orientalis TaxID=1233043 RepID=A0ACC3THT8_9ASCO
MVPPSVDATHAISKNDASRAFKPTLGTSSLGPRKGGVLLHLRTTGVCGSDIHFWKAVKIHELKVLGDYILDHEQLMIEPVFLVESVSSVPRLAITICVEMLFFAGV